MCTKVFQKNLSIIPNSFATPRNLSVPGSRKPSIVGAKTEGEAKKNELLNRSYDETVELSHAAESYIYNCYIYRIDSRIASPGNDQQHIRIDTNNTEKYKDSNNNNISPNSHSNSRQNLGGTGGSTNNNTGILSETKTSIEEEGYNESLQNTANSEFGSTTFSQPPNIFNESSNNNKNVTGGSKSAKSGGGGSMGDNESNDDINDSDDDDDDDKSISLPHASSSINIYIYIIIIIYCYFFFI